MIPASPGPFAAPPPNPATDPAPNPAHRAAAQAMEAQFLSMMLREAGFGRAPGGFGGGAGEDQFGSLMVDAQAKRMAEAGGIGLAESILRAMGRVDG